MASACSAGICPAAARARASAASASSMACSHARSPVASAVPPRARTAANSASDILQVEPHVVLRQRPGHRLGADDVVQLRALELGLERVALLEAVEHRGHPPGEVLHPPDALQAALAVALQPARVAVR